MKSVAKGSVAKGVVLDSFTIDGVITNNHDGDEAMFKQLIEATDWAEVRHKGGALPRLMAIQGSIDTDGMQPIYRHPLDKEPVMAPFSACVDSIRFAVTDAINSHLPPDDARAPISFNHALIQLYRSGEDYISEHADKTVDVARGSVIANFSLGSKRTLILRDKAKKLKQSEGQEPREVHRIPMKSGSCFVMGLDTNRCFLHEIKRDRRRAEEKDEEERGEKFEGARISVTFRDIATLKSSDGQYLTGQGAHFSLSNEDKAALLSAFSLENSTKENSDDIYSRHREGTS